MKTLADLKVGDTATVVDRTRQAQVTVTKVARVYITVAELGRYLRQFRLDNGIEKGAVLGGGVYLRTDDEIAETVRRSAATARLRELGVDIRFGHQNDFATETLEAIIAVIPTQNVEN